MRVLRWWTDVSDKRGESVFHSSVVSDRQHWDQLWDQQCDGTWNVLTIYGGGYLSACSHMEPDFKEQWKLFFYCISLVFWSYMIALSVNYEWMMSQMSTFVCVVLKVVDEVEATRNFVLCFWIYSDRLIKRGLKTRWALWLLSDLPASLHVFWSSMVSLAWANSCD